MIARGLHQHRHEYPRSRGFSLIEVLVAVLILGVALVGLTRGITVALQSSRDAERHSTAVMLAASRIETLRAEGDFISGEQSGDFEDVPGYRWQQTIASAGPEGLYSVEVAVYPAPKTTGAGRIGSRSAGDATAPGAVRRATSDRPATERPASSTAAISGSEPPYFRLETLLFKKPISSTLSSSGEETETERRRRRGEEARARRRATR